jgi:hypothetical protein
MSFERIRRRITFPGVNQIHAQGETNHKKNEDVGEFKKFINIHDGETFIVCGCGNSLNLYEEFPGAIAIGVNDAGRKISCKYLVVVNEPKSFKWGRWKYVEENTADYVFTHLPNLSLPKPEQRVVISLGSPEGTNLENYGSIDYTTNSPYMAVILAYQMGAKKIGIIGVDFTQNHFFAETGTHKINREINRVLVQYENLANALVAKGIKIANLSPESMVNSWPKMYFEEFKKI